MRLLIADDHLLFLQSLRLLLEASGHKVVGSAGDGLEALQQARGLRPDLILMDVDMPNCDGLSATRLIKAELPEVKIVMLTVSASDENLFEAIKSGASGYVLKSQSADKLLESIGQVAAGGAVLPPRLAARLFGEFARQARLGNAPVAAGATSEDLAQPQGLAAGPGLTARPELTARQLEILALVSKGMTYPQIGAALSLSEPTIRYHMGQIMDHLHLENRAQVIAYAASHGLGQSTAQ